MLETVEYSYKGNALTEKDKYMLIDFFEKMNWPYSISLFYDTARRYLEGDFIINTIEMPEKVPSSAKL